MDSPDRCPACEGRATFFACAKLLGHRQVEYMRCTACRTVFLPAPGWLEEAYSNAISALDVGLLQRCIQLANVTDALLWSERLHGGTFLDWAGGYGTSTRLMRDRGWDFRHHDPLCDNIFARGHEGGLERSYDAVTAFEVLEHLTDPVPTLTPIAATTDLLLVTTQVLPEPAPLPGSWDYYALETGQHVSLYTLAGLRSLAERLGCTLTTSGHLVHALHRRPLSASSRMLLRDERLSYVVGLLRSQLLRPKGLTQADSAAAARSVQRPG